MTVSQHLLTKTTYGACIRVADRLDIISARDLQELVIAAIRDGAKHIVFDCSDLEYISSSGLRVLLSARKASRAQGGNVALCHVGTFVQGVLSTTGFDQLLIVHATVAEAEKAIPAG